MSQTNVEMNPQLQVAYDRWMAEQIKSSRGERRDKLKKGLTYSSRQFIARVFWPSVGSFEGWCAEYEVIDFKDGYRYIDMARPAFFNKVAIEADDKKSHGENASTSKFSDDRFRQNDLVIDDWRVLRFSLQSILEQPRRCQQQLMHALATWGFESNGTGPTLLPTETAILKLIENKEDSFSPTAVAKAIGVHRNTAAKHLKSLVDKGKAVPHEASGTGRLIRRYRARR